MNRLRVTKNLVIRTNDVLGDQRVPRGLADIVHRRVLGIYHQFFNRSSHGSILVESISGYIVGSRITSPAFDETAVRDRLIQMVTEHLNTVASYLHAWGAFEQVQTWIEQTQERPRLGKAVSIPIDLGERASEWILENF